MPVHDESNVNIMPCSWRIIGILFACVLAVWCYAPALHAYFAQDDFAFLALVRLLHQPWLLFVHDHFPGSMYFRPLGLLVWWLVCAMAADAAWPQYAVNLILHIGCVVALYTLLQRLCRDAPLNALWAAVFAVHPLSAGTALWLSDRFDLLTTLFSLLAVNAALAYATRPRGAGLCVVLAMLLLALLSKELGVVAAAATFAAIAFAPQHALAARQRVIALVAIALLSLVWLAYRHAMLTPLGDGSAQLPSLLIFAQGSWQWLRSGLQFLGHDPRLPVWSVVLLALATLLWLAAVISAGRARWMSALRWNAVAAVFVLTFLPGLVQATVAIQHLGDISTQTFWFHLVVPSRFFHLSLAGLICLLMLLSTPAVAVSARQRAAPRLAGVAILLALIALAPTTHAIAHTYASSTRAQIASLAAVETALDRIEPPARSCQVYFLQISTLWGFSGYSDAIAKGLSSAPGRLAHCLVSTERPPWTYFVRTSSIEMSDYRPLHPLALAGKPIPPLVLGDVEAMYFTMGDDMRTSIPPTAIFLEYRDGTFVDVSAAVRAGQRKVEFATTEKNP